MLEAKNFKKFEEIVETKPNIINGLRGGRFNWTLLMWAALNERLDIFQHIVSSYEQDVSVVDDLHQNVFHFIADYCPDDMAIEMMTLVDQHQKVPWNDVLNQQDYIKDTPLHKAARYNRHKTIRFLLDKGADCEVRNEDNERPDELPGCDVETKRIIRQYRK